MKNTSNVSLSREYNGGWSLRDNLALMYRGQFMAIPSFVCNNKAMEFEVFFSSQGVFTLKGNRVPFFNTKSVKELINVLEGKSLR